MARSLSFIGDSLGGIALLLYVAATEGNGMAATLLLVGDFPPTLRSPFSGVLSDRLDRKRRMIASEVAQGAIIAAIPRIDMPFAALHGLRRCRG